MKNLLGLGLVALLWASCNQPSGRTDFPVVEAHRGGSSIYPENTLPAFLHAVDLGADYIELDLQMTKDSMVVVSHDAYLNHIKALTPEGAPITADREKDYKIFSMTYDSLRRYDVGSVPNPAFPNRANVATHVPLLSEVFETVEEHIAKGKLHPIKYNIEFKIVGDADTMVWGPSYKVMVDYAMPIIEKYNIKDRILLQSFDARTLNYINEKYPGYEMATLVGGKGTYEEFMSRLNFKPGTYSPNYHMVNKELVEKVHADHMKLVPWTVNTKAEVLRLDSLGVDGIISDKPDSVMIWLGMPKKQ